MTESDHGVPRALSLPIRHGAFLVALYAFHFLWVAAFADLMPLFFASGSRPDTFARYVFPLCVALPQWLIIRRAAMLAGNPA